MAETSFTRTLFRSGRARPQASQSARLIAYALIVAGLVFGIGLPALMNGLFGLNLTLGSGRSMEPSFYDGDLMITRSVSPGSLSPGDVILFEQKGDRIIHRVLSATTAPDGEVTLVTRGDHNTLDDPPISGDAVLGELVFSVAWPRSLPFTPTPDSVIIAQCAVSVTLLLLAMAYLRRSVQQAQPA